MPGPGPCKPTPDGARNGGVAWAACAGRSGPREDERALRIEAWVERSCREQGLPVKVNDWGWARRVRNVVEVAARILVLIVDGRWNDVVPERENGLSHAAKE